MTNVELFTEKQSQCVFSYCFLRIEEGTKSKGMLLYFATHGVGDAPFIFTMAADFTFTLDYLINDILNVTF